MTKTIEAYGKWHVTTEGDVEGRSTTDLGVYEGYLDEIAFALGRKAYYSLYFEPAKELPPQAKSAPADQVHVVLTIDSGTWDMDPAKRQGFFRKLLEGRDVEVKDGQFYASVLLKRGKA
jgi:hypothetical protein